MDICICILLFPGSVVSRVCDLMDCGMPGFPVLRCLLEFAQIHVHWVSDANHLLSPPSPLALNLSRSLSFPMSPIFASIGQSIGASASASILPVNIQGWFTLGLTGWSPCCPRDSQDSSLSPQSKSINSLVNFVYGPTRTSLPVTGKTTALALGTFVGKVMPLL